MSVCVYVKVAMSDSNALEKGMSVWSCVCARERERVCVCVFERASVYVCVYVKESGREQERESARARASERQ